MSLPNMPEAGLRTRFVGPGTVEVEIRPRHPLMLIWLVRVVFAEAKRRAIPRWHPRLLWLLCETLWRWVR